MTVIYRRKILYHGVMTSCLPSECVDLRCYVLVPVQKNLGVKQWVGSRDIEAEITLLKPFHILLFVTGFMKWNFVPHL